MGRVRRLEDQTGTIIRMVYDELGRVTARYRGTNDSSFGGGVVTTGTDDMVKVEELVYDGGSSGGNSHLTTRTQFVQAGTAEQRQTGYQRDYRGRMLLQTNPQSPHLFNKYDNLGRLVASGLFSSTAGIAVGTDDPTTETANRVGLSQTFYDELGRVWKAQRHKIDLADGSDDDHLQTLTWYDPAGRVAKVRGERFTKTRYDGLGRATHRFTLSSSDDADYGDAMDIDGDVVLEEHQSVYDDQGRLVMAAAISRLHNDFGAGQTTGALDSNADGDGLVYTASDKVRGEQFTKTRYDGLGRVTHRFTLSSSDDADYEDALTIDGDVVLEEHQSVYDDQGRLVMSATISRLHNDFGSGQTTGALDSNADGDPLTLTAADLAGRVQITATWYDDLDRPLATAFYGTNHATDNAGTFDRAAAATVPARSDTVLVTSYTYNAAGQTEGVTDPRGLVTRTLYDQAGRRVATIENYTGSAPTTSSDRWTRFEYTHGLLTKQWADLDGDGAVDGDDQVTTYEYGVGTGDSPGASLAASNRLLRRVVYPEQSAMQAATDRDVWYAYNAQGQPIYTQDQTGTVIETTYDTAGRETHRRATALGAGIDGAVRRISTAYNSRGQVETVTQYDDPAVGSGKALDQVRYTYSDWGPVSLFEQDHDSAVGTGDDEYAVAYGYAKATGGRHTVRTTHQTLRYHTTDQQTLTYGYLSSSGGQSLDDDAASRVTTVTSTPGAEETAVLIAEYRYLGADHLVDTLLPEAGVFSRLHDGGSTPLYRDLDRFSRITHSRWTKDLATDRDFYSVELAYDRGSNIVRAVDNIHRDASGNHLFDAVYTVDGLNRVTAVREGHWDGSAITTGNRKREELWDLSATGNWLLRRLDLNGDGLYTGAGELADAGTFNNANELLARDTDNDSADDFTLGYNLRGDLTDNGVEYKNVYDAWGRLRKVLNRSTDALVAEYTYNGLGFRIGWAYDTDADGDVNGDDVVYRFVYDEHWRPVATYRAADGASDTSPKEQWAYHNAGLGGRGGSNYIDSVILRDKDTGSAWEEEATGTLGQRLYLLQNWRADLSVVINHDGSRILEWVKYSAYGVPRVLPWWDTDYDGARTSGGDLAVFNTIWTAAVSVYNVRADTNLDGVINSSDLNANTNDWGAGNSTAERGFLSRDDSTTSVMNRIGYAGYQWDPVIGKYHVRNRVLDPETGRWMRRDPLGYVDGMSLYEYVRGQAVVSQDPTGLAWQHCDGSSSNPAWGGTNMCCPPLPCGTITITGCTATNASGKIHQRPCSRGLTLWPGWQPVADKVCATLIGVGITIPCPSTCRGCNVTNTASSPGAPTTLTLCLTEPGYPQCRFCVTATYTLTVLYSTGKCE